ncbi:membrane protein [Sulfuriferula plumbiphila]|uniref:Membrane protein n=1 Tax=Sulfuriferula plumbiphila TaxID=171865 RepID=A0A512L3K4_9PROT|nr:glycine zipper 2TM domain-containing protein [Sulfuriferula plumbiphila]BBP02761.1 membrane protein [Sulfuriferula plumbiphila]GEP29055.1 membrane protein [Sulfuriferula plumbiphila]
MNPFKLAAFGLAAVLTLGGCASGLGSRDYSRDQARGAQEVRTGVVVEVRNVNIEGTKTPIGAGAGAVVGGIAGSQVGRGNGSIAGAVLGAVVGGLAGSAVEEGVTRQQGLEITVRLDSGRTIAVTQGADEYFRPGDRVRVLSEGGTTRVTR